MRKVFEKATPSLCLIGLLIALLIALQVKMAAQVSSPEPYISDITVPLNTFAMGDTPIVIGKGDFYNNGSTQVVMNPSLFVTYLVYDEGNGTFAATGIFGGDYFGTVNGLAVGDLNGDGNLDVAETTEESLLVIGLGNGNGTFQQTLTYPLSAPCNGSLVGLADFNGDGKLDYALSGGCVLLGDGKGGFTTTLQLSGTPLVIADFNGDGNIDYATQDTSGKTLVFTGNGHGVFTQSYSIASATPLFAGDFNGNGILDLMVQPTGSVGSTLWWGVGNGKFTKGPHLAMSVTGGVTADFNGDNKLDIAFLSSTGATVLLGNGDGTFSQSPLYAYGQGGPSALVAADINGDGKVDLVVASQGTAENGYSGSPGILIGNGDGTFQAATAVSTAALSVAAGDFNNDGKLDFAAVYSGQLSIFLGNGNGSFQAPLNHNFKGGQAVAVGDFNNDGNLDAVVGTDSLIQVFLGNGNGTLKTGTAFNCNCNASSIAVADFNGDGNLDLAITDSSTNTLFLAFGEGNGKFTLGPPIPTGVLPVFLAAGEIIHKGGNDTHKGGNDIHKGGNDLVVANFGPPCPPTGCTTTAGIYLNSGSGELQSVPGPSFSDGNLLSVAVGDFNGDGKADLAVSVEEDLGGKVFILLGNGDGTFQPPTVSLGDYIESAFSVYVTDFNGDGILDIITIGYGGAPPISENGIIDVFLGNGDGTFTTLSELTVFGGLNSNFGVVGDFNGDGAPDFLDTGTFLHLNAGGTLLSTTATPNPVTSGKKVTLATTVSSSYMGAGIPTPTGTVTFVDQSPFPVQTLMTANLVNGTATAETSSLSVGEHPIQPTYSGDSRYHRHVGNPITVTVQSASDSEEGVGGGLPGGAGSSCANAAVSETPYVEGTLQQTKLVGEGGLKNQNAEDGSGGALSGRASLSDVGPQPLFVSQPPLPLRPPDIASLYLTGMPLTSGTSPFGFAGITGFESHSLGGNPDVEPPDQGLGVSTTQVLEAVNDAVAVYDKSTGSVLLGPTLLNSFFGLPAPDPAQTGGTYGPFLSDPRVVYDSGTQRWFVTAIEIPSDPTITTFQSLLPQSTLLIAVSTTSDATQSFKIFSVDLTDIGFGNCPCLGDHPNIGTNENGLFVSTNQYSWLDNSFQTALVLAFDKFRLANGVAPPVVGFQALSAYSPGAFALMPAQSAPGDTSDDGTEYFLNSADQISLGNLGGTQNTLTVWAMTNTASLATTANLTLQALTLTVETYSQPVAATQKKGSTPLLDYLQSLCTSGCTGTETFEKLDQDDDRVQQVSLSQGILYGVLETSVYSGKTAYSGVAWFSVEPSVSSCSLSAQLTGQGYLSLTKGSLLYPAVAVNTSGQGAIAFSMASGSEFPAFGYVTIAAGQVGSTIQTAQSGSLPEDGFSGYALPLDGVLSYIPPGIGVARWGDYSAVAIDPEGNTWFAGEYIPSNNYQTLPTIPYTNWGTWVTELNQ